MKAAGLAALLALAMAACEPRSHSHPDTMERIDALFADFSRPGLPGAAVLVQVGDSVAVRRSYGLADVEAGLAVTPATNFRLASLSKQFTATAVLLLAADGKLGLDDPVRRHLPALPAFAEDVTVRHLLTHTSGLADYEDYVPAEQEEQVHDADVLRLVATRSDSLYFPAGTAWRYSNTGYALLALIVEQVSGSRYADFLEQRIFGPAGMAGTVAFEAGRSEVAHRAYGHRVTGDSVRRTDQSNTSAVLGDGGIYSSIDDLSRWAGVLSAGSILPAEQWRDQTTAYILADGTPTTYGFGWFVDRFRTQPRLRHHGETRGFTNAILRFPERDVTIIILTNRTGSAPWDLADSLATLFLD